MGMLTTRRRVMGKNKPYDAEVEYIEFYKSNKPQKFPYITLNHKITDILTEFYIDVAITDKSETNYILSNQYDINHRLFRFIYRDDTKGFELKYNSPAVGQQPSPWDIKEGAINRLHIAWNYIEDLDTGNKADGYQSNTDFTNDYPIRLGGSYYSADFGGYFRLYSLKVLHDGELLYDLIPVRKDKTGYLYNRITGELMGNEREDSEKEFGFGPDIN